MNKPIITARERSPFGDISPEEAMESMAHGHDIYWLPGYSDKRQKRDLDVRDGKPVSPLTHRFQLVRVSTTDGKPTTRGMTDFGGKGYKPVKGADCKALGISLDNTNYSVGADGLVYMQDNILTVCDAKTASRNYADLQRRNDAETERAQARMQDAAERYNRTTGLTEKTGTSAIFEVVHPDSK